MSTPESNGFADLNQFSEEMYKQWEKGVTAWWDQLLDSKEFLGASGRQLAGMAQARAVYEKNVDEQLSRMHLPTRGDMTRLARIATLLEKRLLEMEDTVLEIRDGLARHEQAVARAEKEALQARIEAAEARVALAETLAALDGRLAAIETNTQKPARRSRAAAKPSSRQKTDG
jgi:uncharacterized coiled-coil protein SlyX